MRTGALYLGDPRRETDTKGLHFHQRQWYANVAKPTHMPYWIAVWIHREHHPKGRIYHKHAVLYLVPIELWLALVAEAQRLGTKTVPLLAKDGKLSVLGFFGGYELEYAGAGEGFVIPLGHPVWGVVGK